MCDRGGRTERAAEGGVPTAITVTVALLLTSRSILHEKTVHVFSATDFKMIERCVAKGAQEIREESQRRKTRGT